MPNIKGGSTRNTGVSRKQADIKTQILKTDNQANNYNSSKIRRNLSNSQPVQKPTRILNQTKMTLSFFIFLGSFFGILTAFVGGSRGYNLLLMYLVGFIAGPLGLGIAYLLPNRSEEQPEDPQVIIHQQEEPSKLAA